MANRIRAKLVKLRTRPTNTSKLQIIYEKEDSAKKYTRVGNFDKAAYHTKLQAKYPLSRPVTCIA